jgi:hypothetical protein
MGGAHDAPAHAVDLSVRAQKIAPSEALTVEIYRPYGSREPDDTCTVETATGREKRRRASCNVVSEQRNPDPCIPYFRFTYARGAGGTLTSESSACPEKNAQPRATTNIGPNPALPQVQSILHSHA